MNAPKHIKVGGVNFIRVDPPRQFRAKLKKIGTVVNICMFDMAAGKEAQQFIRNQLGKKRRVFVDDKMKLDYTIIATDVPDNGKLLAYIPHRFPVFKNRKFELRELTQPEELDGPLPSPEPEPEPAAEEPAKGEEKSNELEND